MFVFSDIHGNRYSFNLFLGRIEQEKPDQVVFLGDVFGYYYYAEEILKIMRNTDWLCLLGNHDDLLLQVIDGKRNPNELSLRYGSIYKKTDKITQDSMEFLRGLKPNCEMEINNLRIGFFHGTPSDALNGRWYPDTDNDGQKSFEDYDLLLLGHTHHKMVRKTGNTVIINPGSLGQQRDGKGCSFVAIDTCLKTVEFQIVEYNMEQLVSDIQKYDNGNPMLKDVLFRRTVNEFEGKTIFI